MELINSIIAVCSLVLVISAIIMGILHYVVITPLRVAIDRISETIEWLEKAVGAWRHSREKWARDSPL